MKKKRMKMLMLVALCLLVCGSVASAKSPTVAKIGSKGYSSLESALNAVKKGQTIKLQADVAPDGEVVSKKNVKFTLDLNEHTLSNANEHTYQDIESARGVLCIAKGNVTLKNGMIHDAVRVEKGAKLTIQSGSYEQLLNLGTTVINKATFIPKVGNALYNIKKGKLTINNVVVNSDKGVLYQDGGIVVVKEGTFYSLDQKAQHSVVLVRKGTLTIKGGTFRGENAGTLNLQGGKTTVTGGTFNNNTSKTVTAYVASGASLTVKGGRFSAKKNTNLLSVAGTVEVDGGIFTSSWSYPIMVNKGGKLTVTRKIKLNGSNHKVYNESGKSILKGKTYSSKGTFNI